MMEKFEINVRSDTRKNKLNFQKVYRINFESNDTFFRSVSRVFFIKFEFANEKLNFEKKNRGI